MRIAKVIGTVTLSRAHPTFVGSRLKLVVPLSLAELRNQSEPAADQMVVWEDLGAGIGDFIAMSEGGEASQPFRPHDKAVDAYAAAILDQLQIDPA